LDLEELKILLANLGDLIECEKQRIKTIIKGQKYFLKIYTGRIRLGRCLDRSGFEEWLQIYIAAKMSPKCPSIKDFHHGLSINF